MPRKGKKEDKGTAPKGNEKSNGLLFESVRYGMMAEADRALREGADVNARNSKGATPLHIAVAMHFEDTARMLIEKGADANVKDDRGITPMNIAVYNGDNGIAEALLKAGAGPDEPDENGTTPLFMAVGSGNKELSKVLLDAGADTKRTILDGLALMHVVAFSGDIELAKMLVDKGTGINPLTEKQMDDYPADSTPLDIAELKGNAEVAALIKEHGGKKAKDIKGKKSKR
jgi:ankyrin repeat protein